jgi:uncharacterized protein YkwD
MMGTLSEQEEFPMRWRVVLFGLSLLIAGPAAEDRKPPAKVELSAEEQAILDLTNKARAAEKLPPLSVNPRLMQAARKHSRNMAKQDKLEHELDEKTVGDRADAEGYDYAEVGENIAAANGAKPETIVENWLKSKGHRENLLGTKFTDIGLGVAKNEKGETYYTQVFGTLRKK